MDVAPWAMGQSYSLSFQIVPVRLKRSAVDPSVFWGSSESSTSSSVYRGCLNGGSKSPTYSTVCRGCLVSPTLEVSLRDVTESQVKYLVYSYV